MRTISTKISKYQVITGVLIAIGLGIVALLLMSSIFVLKNDLKVDKNKIIILSKFDSALMSKKALLERIKTHEIWDEKQVHNEEIPAAIESDLKKNPLVKDVQVFLDTKGYINVQLSLYQPIARLARDGAPNAFITNDGTLMPRIRHKAIRLLLITGEYADRIIQERSLDLITADLLGMLRSIRGDSFLSSQITQLDIDNKGEITIYPQVGKQKFIFGKTKNYKKKLAKFKLTYTKIFPKKGWGYYNEINLKYKNQIIANHN